MLIESQDNPNEQKEGTFDQLVEGIKKDGFDEPIIVIPAPDDSKDRGKYIIVSGHHRFKAAKIVGMKMIPSVIKSGWSDEKRQMELIRRNMLRGNLNPEKFTTLYDGLMKKGYDAAILRKYMGFTSNDAFNKIYKSIGATLNAEQKKTLDQSKEKIRSVDDLSSVLNKIFTEHGSDLDHSFLVFSYGGKEHVFVKMDKALHERVKSIATIARERDLDMNDIMSGALKKLDLSSVAPSPEVEKRRVLRRPTEPKT